jgi:hypothetical protein
MSGEAASGGAAAAGAFSPNKPSGSSSSKFAAGLAAVSAVKAEGETVMIVWHFGHLMANGCSGSLLALNCNRVAHCGQDTCISEDSGFRIQNSGFSLLPYILNPISHILPFNIC